MISGLGSSIFLECAPDDGSDALVLSLDKTQFGVPCKINADKKKEVLEDYVAQSRVIAAYGLLDVSSSVVVVVPTTIQATYSNCLLSVTIPKGKVYGSTVLNSKLGTITLKYTPEGKGVQSKSIDLYVRPDTSHEVIKANFGEEISKFNQDVIDLSDALEEKADANDIPVLASDGKTIVFGENQRLTTVTDEQFEVLQGEFETAEEAMAGAANENDHRIINYSTELRQTSREISLSAQAVQSNYENTAKALADAVTAKKAAIQAKADAESAKDSVTDMYSEISVTAEGITQTAASVTETAGQVNEKYTQIQQTASGITLTASQVSSDAASAGQAKNAAEDALSNVQTIKNNIDTAKTAVDDAKKAVEDVETTINGVKTTIDGIKGEIDTAKGAVETAQQGAEDAKALAENARDAAQAAQGLAETAKANAVSAQTAAETAQGLAETAKAEAITAKGGAETARDGAVSAKNDAVSAKDNAVTAKNDAVNAKDAAEGFKNDASSSAQEASGYAGSASESADNAATSESNASASADSASKSASNASTSESNAHQYALDSESYYSQIGLDAQGMTGVFASVKTYTDGKAQEASDSASAAAGSASSAEGSANSALDSANSASASATRVETAISSFNANAEEIVGSVTKQIEENEEALAGAANDMNHHVEIYNTEMKQTAEEIRLSAVKIEAEKVDYSEFKQRAESIEASVSEIDDNKVDYSEFSQRANAIQLSVTNLDKRVGDIIAGEGSSEVYVTQTEFELLSDKVGYVVTGTAGGYSVNGSVILGLMFDDNGQMKSQYSVSADNITNLASYISNTVTNGTVSASIVQAINNGSSEVKISADHIVLNGEAVANSIKTETVELGDGSSKFFADGTGYLGQGGFVYNNDALYIRPMKTSGQSDSDTMNVATTRGIKFNPDGGMTIVNHSGETTGNQYDVLYVEPCQIRGRIEQRQGVGDGATQSIKDKFILDENTLAFHDWAEIYLGNGSTIYIGEEYISVDEDGDVSISEGIIDAIRDAL